MIEKITKEYKQVSFFRKTLPFWLCLIILLPLSAFSSFLLAFKDRIYPQVSVCGINLGGKNENEVKEILSAEVAKNFPKKITLIDNNTKLSLEIKSLYYAENDTFKKTMQIGRDNKLFKNLINLVSLARKPSKLTFVLYYDQPEFENKLNQIYEDLSQAPVNPQIKIVEQSGKNLVVLEKGKSGQEVNINKLKESLINSLSCPQPEINLQIPFLSKIPSVSDELAENTKSRATLFLNKEIKLRFKEQTWTIDDEEMINFLSFYDGFDQQKIANFVTNLAKVINSPPANPTFNFENNRVIVFKPAKEGIALKEAEFSLTLEKRLQQIETSQENQEIEIPVIKISPKITTDDSNSLGIKELLGKGSSDFSGSIKDRIYNLTLATTRLNGILVPPGEEFSFLKSLGEISLDTGYRQGYIIKEGKTQLGDGGGVCQVSTTVFRAALNAGLPIIERRAHAYRVSYYEKDIGPGFDATVAEPSTDLKFINNTLNYILIQSSIKDQKIFFEIYGTSDGRKVEISPVRVFDRQPPPPDLYLDDLSLPSGKIKQTEHRIWGSKTTFNYKVTKDNEVLEEKTFLSTYSPWQAVYLRGIGN